MDVVKTAAASPPAPSARQGAGDGGTRDRIAGLIGQEGPVTVSDLADSLGLTTAAVRRHVDVMLEEGHVEVRELRHVGRRGRGRPAKAYVLTTAAHAQLASGYDEIAVQALRFLAEQAGPSAVRAFAQKQAADLAERLRGHVDQAGDDIRKRVAALAEALRNEGFAASVRPVGRGTPGEAVQLCQGHCPVQQVAASFPELCEAETEAFGRLIGVDVRRLATLAHGDHVCTTHIPIGPPTARRRTEPSHETPAPDMPEMRGESS